MAKRMPPIDEFDGPWKEALQAYLPYFLAFFFADIHADVDWSRGYQSLDKEFQKITRRAKVGKRLADKLFRVWLADGSEHWLLIHIEVQGEYEKEFPARMFDYNAAARQLYNKDVVSLAVLCDDRPDWRPTTFAHGRWGCKMELTFRIAKLLDYADQVEALEASDNRMAAIVLAHCKTLETRRDPESRRQWKLRIVKGLYRRRWSKDDVIQLFRVIDWMMALPEELERAFLADFEELPEEKTMRYVTSIERLAIKDADEKARREELMANIAAIVDAKFAPLRRKLLRSVRALSDLDELRRFLRFLGTATTIEEVEEYVERFQE